MTRNNGLIGLLEAFFDQFDGSDTREADPTDLDPGEYEAARHERGHIELYDGREPTRPLLSVPREDAERIHAALGETLEESGAE